MDEVRNWVFTFGVGEPGAGFFVELRGTFHETRTEMFRMFGNKWAFQYEDRKDAGVEEYGLTKLFVNSVLCDAAEDHREETSGGIGQQRRAHLAVVAAYDEEEG